ncbi:uncharacterized protein LOC109838506 [Asparagus officinalis]|uniref:uncharacterized protein LOC109838506 n=1 Tax=Asparagus officinalis TaxID=4686 RepID=UPI00098E2D29|nr:uncharacterized protein LOC109838506 [Asparagus officinalis]
MGHRRYLDENHSWRKDKKSFDGTRERGYAAPKLTGDDILKQVEDLIGITLTNHPEKKIKISHERRGDNWNKKSIFFDLPYWRTLLLRHNLDVMHIEKNICDSLLGTIMNIKGKTKDNIKARLDLQAMSLKPELHPIQRGDKLVMPAACYTLSQEEQSKFCRFLKELKVPDGFSSNISQCVNLKERKILGLKSHDCHILLQCLIPVSINDVLLAKVCEPIIELSIFFTILCAKTLRVDELKQIDEQIPLTLCKLEKIFPPSIFDVMLHLVVHLASEAILGGPVRFRWMYPVERQLYTYKSYIRNRARPEGSIAEGYIADECMTFCSRYLKGFETKFNHLERNYEDGNRECHEAQLSIFRHSGRALGAATTRYLDERDYNEFVREPTNQYDDKDWDKNFIEWFQALVYQSYREDDDLLSLSRDPNYYGALVEVVELEYPGRRKVVLFRCKWWDVHGKGKIHLVNRAIEPEFSRYLGIIIRDRNICQVAVENWAKIPQQNKDHMWASIKDKFDAEDMEQKRELVMRHLRDLWNKWRGDMHRKYVKENSLQVALRNKPTEVSVDDWDWLVKEHYFSSKFQKASQQNTLNRGKRKMLHHTEIGWQVR